MNIDSSSKALDIIHVGECDIRVLYRIERNDEYIYVVGGEEMNNHCFVSENNFITTKKNLIVIHQLHSFILGASDILFTVK